jgi:HSP20 family molecular chaperone IbpA
VILATFCPPTKVGTALTITHRCSINDYSLSHSRAPDTACPQINLARVLDDKEYLIKTELPEMRKEDVKVTAENGVLTISGERKFEKEEKKKKYHRVERGFGTFMRSFALPDDADFSKVNAEFKNGVLTVHVPKSEHAKPKQIDVKVA